MTKHFVAINDPVHQLIRKITRITPLCPFVSPNQVPTLHYQIREQELPEAYFSLAVLHTLGGLSLEAVRQTRWGTKPIPRAGLPERVNFFDAVSLDRRCTRDLRFKLGPRDPGLLSAELLTYGTGMLRARNDDPLEQIHHRLWRQYGRLAPEDEVVYAQIRALHWNSLPLLHQTQKESYDSTNLIYGDAYGELEQLWDRRADTAFLNLVAQSLQRMRGHAQIAAFLAPPLNLPAVMSLHLRSQALWIKPPANGRVLLRRIEKILNHTTLDNSPKIEFRWRDAETQPKTNAEQPQSLGARWNSDRTGYDGWLADNR
jgi:hypothetical protein